MAFRREGAVAGDAKPACVVIGYYEPPFDEYERLVRSYGEHSAAYRDLRLSFVTVDGRSLTYVDLINEALGRARRKGSASGAAPFRSGDIPNLAAVYLTSFLCKRGVPTAYINLFEFERDRLAEYLSTNPICVAITTTFYVVNLPVVEIVRFIRQHNPSTTVIVGGPLIANHFRNYADPAVVAVAGLGAAARAAPSQNVALQSVLEDIGADIYINEAQGELTLFRVIRCLQSGASLDRVANIAYADGLELRVTAREPENNALDDNTIAWSELAPSVTGRTIQLRTARSCAFNCSFCNYPTRAGKLALAGLDAIKKELDSIRARGGIEHVVFIDDTFNVPLPRFKDICRLMIEQRYGFRWFSYFRCSNADAEAIELMARSGCGGVFLGIESGSPAILTNMNKAATIEKYAEGIQRLRQHGIMTFASFIAGFPGETPETIRETREFVEQHAPDFYRVQLWYREPGTPIERQQEHYRIAGHGFGWSHATMASAEAVSHIESMFLGIEQSTWLPQWSFDFWILPYLLGRGLSLDQIRQFVRTADELLALQIRGAPNGNGVEPQRRAIEALTDRAAEWTLR